MVDSAALPALTLARRQALPVKMVPVRLLGKRVILEPLDVDRDSQELFSVSNGSPIHNDGFEISAYDADLAIWRYMPMGPFSEPAEFRRYLEGLVANQNGLALCVFDTERRTQVGVTTFMNNFPEHLKLELGSIWYSPVVQGKGANLEATYLMLEYAFSLGYRRVEWKCDALNERSRKAALRMGFKFEGVQQSHFIVKDKNRDTAWFRMLDSEWTEQQAVLENAIGQTPPAVILDG